MRTLYAMMLVCLCLLPNIARAKTEHCTASIYLVETNGRKTASGVPFDDNKFTAAHKTLPFHSLVRVTNLSNDRTVTVRITDRGPFVKGRCIDLSSAAAKAIGLTWKKGLTRVKVERSHGELGGYDVYRPEVTVETEETR
jgi:rare lipoprotein A